MSSAVQVPEEVTSKGGDSLGSGERCSVHAAANKPPTRSALLRNARRIAILSALGSPALRRQHVPHTRSSRPGRAGGGCYNLKQRSLQGGSRSGRRPSPVISRSRSAP